MIRKLMLAGADAFRINMSHGDQKQKAKLVEHIRALEKEFGRPTTILFDLQGPKLRVGNFEGGKAVLEKGSRFMLDRDETAGDAERVQLPHPELFEAVRPGTSILIDDGKVRLNVLEADDGQIVSEVEVGGTVSDNKGVNVPDVRGADPGADRQGPRRPAFALEQSADWIALSFVQRPEDVAEARELIGERAALLAKIEKPAAIDRLNDIIELADGVMVARGDLGVELPPEAGAAAAEPDRRQRAPVRQAGGRRDADARIDDHLADADPGRGQRRRHRDLRRRRRGHAVGRKRGGPISGRSGEDDGPHRQQRRARPELSRRASTSPRPGPSRPPPTRSPARRGRSRSTVSATAMVCYTSSGSTARRIARERPSVPLLAMSASLNTRARLGLLWGAHAVHTRDVASFEEMVEKGKRMALRHQLAKGGDRIVLMAGIPFGTAGLDQRAPRRPADRRRARALPGEQEPQRGSKRREFRPAISRARKPIGPTFVASAAPGFAVQPHRPQQGAERLGAARQQAADNSREHVAAARNAEPRRAAVVGPGVAVGRDDVAGDALDQHDRLDRARPRAGRSRPGRARSPPRRSRAMTRVRPRGEAGSARLARSCFRQRLEAVKQRGVEREPCRRTRARRRAICSQAFALAMPGPATIASTSRRLAICFDRGDGEAAVVVLRQARRPSLRALRTPSCERDAFDRDDPQLAGAGAHGGRRGEHRRAGHVAAAGDDQDPPLRLLVAVDDRRQRMSAKRGAVERRRLLHRVPAIASGSEVFGAPSASSGAPWFHSAELGNAQALARRARIHRPRCRN